MITALEYVEAATQRWLAGDYQVTDEMVATASALSQASRKTVVAPMKPSDRTETGDFKVSELPLEMKEGY